MTGKFELDGFLFHSKKEFDKAKKEKEAILYIETNSDLENAVLVLKIYNRLIEKESFQTVIGYEFLRKLQAVLKADDAANTEKIQKIPVKQQQEEEKIQRANETPSEEAKNAERYKELYEKERTGKIKYRIIIGFLVFIIGGMFAVAQLTPYSVFTNYEDKIVDKYQEWQQQLEEREQKIQEIEQNLQ